MEKEILTLLELASSASHTAKLLIKSEMALNDGEVDTCQKLTSEAAATMGVLVKDMFEETVEMFNLSVEDCVDYDLPCALELANQLSEIAYNANTLSTMLMENQPDNIKKIVYKTLSKHMETATEIYNALFNN